MRLALRERMLSSLLPEQRRSIEDPSRLKALFCTRRAGKSWAIGVYLFLTALAFPGSSSLYLGLTRATSHGIMLKDIFRVINKTFDLGAKWIESKSRWELPNGSHIYLRGTDANQYEIDKMVGQKYRLAVLDEASKYRHDVNRMVYGSLLPAMGDDLGTIVLSGTPSNVTTGLFFEATNGKEPGWTTHSWSWRDNRFKARNIQRVHDELVASNPAITITPLYQQEWQGRWVVDTNALVYRAREDTNTAAALPLPADQYLYVLGVDTGFSDPTAFVVVAWSEHDPNLYVVEAEKHKGWIYSKVVERVKALETRFPLIVKIVVDAPLQGAEEMRQRGGVNFEAATKNDKKLAVDLVNSDLLTGRVKVLPAAMGLFDEWKTLVWSERELRAMPAKYVEDPRFDNHMADACLYAWRASRNYNATQAPAPPPVRGTEPWLEERIERQRAEARRIAELGPGSRFILDEAPPDAMRFHTG